jgi:hypothetical protein
MELMVIGRARLAVLVLAGLFLAPGCSWIFTQPLSGVRFGDPDSPSDPRVLNCSTNLAPPVFDTVFTLTNLASAIYVATDDNATNQGTAVGLGLAVAALWASSAYYGYFHTSECKEAIGDDDFTDMTRARPVGTRLVPSRRRTPPPPRSPSAPATSPERPSGEHPAPAAPRRELPPPFSQ